MRVVSSETPGLTAFTVIPLRASATAKYLHILSSAALAEPVPTQAASHLSGLRVGKTRRQFGRPQQCISPLWTPACASFMAIARPSPRELPVMSAVWNDIFMTLPLGRPSYDSVNPARPPWNLQLFGAAIQPFSNS